ncbi:hypothetical protein [Streptomyces sp. CC210A]|uniref:hypothetical protein n=1 Tax=Streptomyces sp. CC210A TaxID=2898184 RepID=UPI001F344D79|nr:hypothetical protein [Streptomyces sp. CC210A]
MGAIVGAAALTVAVTRTTRVGALRRVGPVATRLGGGLLLLAGAYVAYYGWYEIRVLRGASDGTDPVVFAVGEVQTRVADALGAVGAPVVAAVALLLLVAAAVAAARLRGRRRAEKVTGAEGGGGAGGVTAAGEGTAADGATGVTGPRAAARREP